MANNKDKKLDKVSVITTFYNAEKFVLDAINSVNQQVIDGFELEYVIVDDKSQDNTRTLVEKFIKDNVKNPNATWRLIEPEENLGCGGARKFGIDNATGDYFMFLDADDYYLHIDFVKRAYEEITREKADIVEYGMIMNQLNGQQTSNTAPQRFIIENNPSGAEVALFKDNLIKFNVWCKIYTRAIVESYPYSTTRTYEDVRTIPVWVSNAKKIVIMPTPEVNYRAAAGSIIRTDMVKTRLGTITAIAELFPRFKGNLPVLKAMYTRAMVDLKALLHNHSSNDEGFNEMSRLNTTMLSYILKNWKDVTYHVEDDHEVNPQLLKQETSNATPIENLENTVL
jgi:glycosyltransferase involved in cell wall biosynthesis